MAHPLPCLFVAMASLAAAAELPRVDLHVHIHDDENPAKSLQPADAVALSQKLGVRFGILAEGGCRGDIHDNASLSEFIHSMAGQQAWRGLQVYGFDWRRCLSDENLSQLDYIAADALIFPMPDGSNVRLWMPEARFSDPQDFMERYVDYTVRVLSQRIQVWANPTFLPESLQSSYDALWTPVRMDKVIRAAIANHVAIEINARYQIPSAAFIRRAKASGAKFSFGSNRHVQGIGEIDFCLRRAKECGLTPADIYLPSRRMSTGQR